MSVFLSYKTGTVFFMPFVRKIDLLIVKFSVYSTEDV